MLAELRSRAGQRTDILAHVAGTWAGYHGDYYTRMLADALAAIEGAAEWVEVGRRQRSVTPHGTP